MLSLKLLIGFFRLVEPPQKSSQKGFDRNGGNFMFHNILITFLVSGWLNMGTGKSVDV